MHVPSWISALSALALVTTASMTRARAPIRATPVTYITARPGAESIQTLTLVLDRSGRASLTTSYPDLESRRRNILPIQELGTWRDRGATVLVRFTRFGLLRDGTIPQPRPDNNVITFVLQRCILSAVQYSKVSYGEAGLTFDRSDCRG